jgi:hypothetical protein
MRLADHATGIRHLRLGAVAAAAAVAIAIAAAFPVGASTTYAVSAHFTEPIAPSVLSGCPASPEGFCGLGLVAPFGTATDVIEFGAGCGGACDLRTITLTEGTLVLAETFSEPGCPGSCHPNPASPASGSLSDVVIGGSGIFAGATGTLTGTVKAAGGSKPAGESQVTLSGTITLEV